MKISKKYLEVLYFRMLFIQETSSTYVTPNSSILWHKIAQHFIEKIDTINVEKDLNKETYVQIMLTFFHWQDYYTALKKEGLDIYKEYDQKVLKEIYLDFKSELKYLLDLTRGIVDENHPTVIALKKLIKQHQSKTLYEELSNPFYQETN